MLGNLSQGLRASKCPAMASKRPPLASSRHGARSIHRTGESRPDVEGCLSYRDPIAGFQRGNGWALLLVAAALAFARRRSRGGKPSGR